MRLHGRCYCHAVRRLRTVVQTYISCRLTQQTSKTAVSTHLVTNPARIVSRWLPRTGCQAGLPKQTRLAWQPQGPTHGSHYNITKSRLGLFRGVRLLGSPARHRRRKEIHRGSATIGALPSWYRHGYAPQHCWLYCHCQLGPARGRHDH